MRRCQYRAATPPKATEAISLAALELQRWDDAVRHLQTYVDFGPGLLFLNGHHAVGHIMLARAHAGAGRAAEARRAYEAAFRIWRRADADLPLLVKARNEYERLPKGEGRSEDRERALR